MEKKREGRLTLSSDVLQSLLENGKSPLSDQFLRWKLWGRWKEVVGPTIGENTDPVGYNNGVLYVWVKNSSWMQQLIFMREPIRETINKKMGRSFVRMIHFTLDRKSVPTENAEEIKKVVEKLIPE